MYEIIKNVLIKGNYELKDILHKINQMYIESELAEEEKTELEELARTNANPENSYAPLQKQIDNLYLELNTLKSTVEANAQGMSALKEAVEKLGGTITEPEIPVTEEYPEYKQPTGAHDAYKVGDKITFKGEKYECIYEKCVWSPEEYPSAWKKIVENV